MDDERGNLALEFLKLARRIRARWVVFENVPGLLSSNGGKDFGSFIGGLAELGYGWAYRILDAQYAGVPQRRRRIFVVGYFGDWRRAAAVLFERQSVSWNTPPRRKTGQDITGTLGARGESGGGLGTDFELRGGIQLHGHCAQERTPHIAFSCKDSGADSGDISPTLRGMGSVDGTPSGGGQVAVMVSAPITDGCTKGSSVNDGKKGSPQNLITTKHCVRRLTPRECERLQGFPDDYTAITYRGKPAADSNRYKSIGNSFAVPVVKWIGQRILEVEARLSSVL
jgi:DNA (cytosine-5)-methyltransferase 1